LTCRKCGAQAVKGAQLVAIMEMLQKIGKINTDQSDKPSRESSTGRFLSVTSPILIGIRNMSIGALSW
jgi:hypothetical protein